MSMVKRFSDGLINIVANLGTARDKASHTQYALNVMNPATLYAAYQGSWLAAAIVDYPAEDATRKWRQWRAEVDQIEAIERLEKELQLQDRVHDAMIAARLYGGAAIYINTEDQDQSKPLRVGTEIRSLVVLSSNDIRPEEIIRDINSKYYGKAEYYVLQSRGDTSRIHASRLAIFYGTKMPTNANTFASTNGWGISVLQSTMDSIKNVDATMANVASLVFEAKVDVFKFEGFADMLENTANDELLTRRLMTQAAMKSINGAVVIDAQDDYQQKNASFASLSEVIREFKEAASGAARIPMTRLYGRTTAGLSGSGEGDERVYYDRIGHEQATEIAPAIRLIDECIKMQALGKIPPEIYFEWRPLRQLTESERAEIFTKTASAARSLAGPSAGELIPLDALSEALVNELSEQGMLPGLDQAIVKYGSLGEQGVSEALITDVRDVRVIDAEPMPLYVSRNVTNAKEIIAHYAGQGIEGLIDPADMHVTITYSRNPVDWMKMGEAWENDVKINAGGARVNEGFGQDGKTLVLSFNSGSLKWRHNDMVEAGASWDWPDYQPHITIATGYNGDISDIEPWIGAIELGPELFKKLDENWKGSE